MIVFVASQDQILRERWASLLADMGHEIAMTDPATLCTHQSGLCLLDFASCASSPSSLEALVRRNPALEFMAMAPVPNAADGLRVLALGCKAYCNRQMSPEALAAAVTAVLCGEIWAGRKVTDNLLQHALSRPVAAPDRPVDLSALTPRELEVAKKVADGLSNKAIAFDLGLTVRTVKAHLNAIFRKTHATNRVQLALAVSQVGVAPLASA